MRDTFVVFTILILIIGGSIFTHHFYEETKNEFEGKLNDLLKTIDEEDDKENRIKDIEELWKNKENILIVFQDHDSIDEIERSLYECFHYYRINEEEHFELSKANFIKEMEDLVKREHLTAVNIF